MKFDKSGFRLFVFIRYLGNGVGKKRSIKKMQNDDRRLVKRVIRLTNEAVAYGFL